MTERAIRLAERAGSCNNVPRSARLADRPFKKNEFIVFNMRINLNLRLAREYVCARERRDEEVSSGSFNSNNANKCPIFLINN